MRMSKKSKKVGRYLVEINEFPLTGWESINFLPTSPRIVRRVISKFGRWTYIIGNFTQSTVHCVDDLQNENQRSRFFFLFLIRFY